MSKPKLYTAKELAAILGVHPQTIYRAGERGELASYKVGRSVRFEMPGREQNNVSEEFESRR